MKNVPELFGNLVFNEETMRQRLPQSVFLAMLRSIEEGNCLLYTSPSPRD